MFCESRVARGGKKNGSGQEKSQGGGNFLKEKGKLKGIPIYI